MAAIRAGATPQTGSSSTKARRRGCATSAHGRDLSGPRGGGQAHPSVDERCAGSAFDETSVDTQAADMTCESEKPAPQEKVRAEVARVEKLTVFQGRKYETGTPRGVPQGTANGTVSGNPRTLRPEAFLALLTLRLCAE